MVNFVDYVSRQFEVPTSWQIADLAQPVYELAESATLYLATDKPFMLKPEEVQQLREYIQAGGLLVAAPEGTSTGATVKSMRALAAQLFPRQRVAEGRREASVLQPVPKGERADDAVVDGAQRDSAAHGDRGEGHQPRPAGELCEESRSV